ncbi:MAG TPA: AAA family ATPase [Chloroflexi bacterium]|nr:AAA family ATPase [Chloroflexota bacterium]
MKAYADLSIQLLGGLCILVGGANVRIDQPRLQRLLVYLLLHRRHPRPRQQIAFTLWPDTNDGQALKNLRTLLTRLRHMLPDLDQYVETTPYALQWRQDAPCQLDVVAFEAACAEGMQADRRQQAEIASTAYARAAQLYTGDLTPGWYDEWLVPERERLRQMFLDALERLTVLWADQGDHRAALGYAQQLQRADPLHEAAYRQLMQLHLELDDRAAALRVYHTCATTLRNELGVDPAPATQALYLQVLTVDEEVAAPAGQVAAPSISATTPVAAALVGRQAEWEALTRAWQATTAGRAHLVLISGEAGIGKTRLAEELLAWVERQGTPVALARGYAGGSLAYAPVTEWLRSAGLRQNVQQLEGIWRSETARLLPELLSEHPDLPAPSPMTEAWQRQRFFQALSRAVLGAAPDKGDAMRPLLLLLDDAQWCDRETLDWLHYLLQTNANLPLLVLATVRTEEVDKDHPLNSLQLAVMRDDLLHEVALTPLNAAETAALAGDLLGKPLTTLQAVQLFQDTEGNPLFAVEMVRAGMGASETGRGGETGSPGVEDAALALPPKVSAVIRRRLALLSSGAHGLAQIAAVIGREFTFAMLACTSGQDESTVVQGLDELWRRRLVREQGANAYDFSHDKIRAVAYAELSPVRRRALHLHVAEATAALYADNLDAVSAQVAAHYALAGQSQAAIRYYRQAAAASRSVFAHCDACVYLERALDLLSTLPEPISRRTLAALLQEQLGDLCAILARHDDARTYYFAALADTPDAERFNRARLHRKIGKILENEQRPHDLVAAQYRAAADLLGAPDPLASSTWWEEWCQLQLEQLLLLYWWGRTDDLAALMAYAQPLIEQHGTPLQCASLFNNLARQLTLHNRFTPSDTVLTYARAALERASQVAGPESCAAYQFAVGFNLLWNGALAEAVDVLDVALDTAVATDDLMLQARCLTYLGITHRLRQDTATTTACARRGLAVAEKANMQEYVGANCANLAWAALKADDLSEAERLLQRAVTTWRQHARPYPFYWQALLPLISLAMTRDALGEAVAYAQTLVDSHQQKLADPIEPLLLNAIATWQTQDVAGARQSFTDAVGHAVAFGYL